MEPRHCGHRRELERLVALGHQREREAVLGQQRLGLLRAQSDQDVLLHGIEMVCTHADDVW